jgi:hypothetical protein
MTENVLELSESQLEELYESCPHGGKVTLVWATEEFQGELRLFGIKKEFRLVPLEAE